MLDDDMSCPWVPLARKSPSHQQAVTRPSPAAQGSGTSTDLLAGFTGVTILGLAKLNLMGPGITETVKSFWRPKRE